MTLSRRCWRAVARRLPENGSGVAATLRTRMEAAEVFRHKRHSLVELDLEPAEAAAVIAVLRDPPDPYMAYVVDHEWRTNGQLLWRPW